MGGGSIANLTTCLMCYEIRRPGAAILSDIGTVCTNILCEV